jgi:hypothetical protein
MGPARCGNFSGGACSKESRHRRSGGTTATWLPRFLNELAGKWPALRREERCAKGAWGGCSTKGGAPYAGKGLARSHFIRIERSAILGV